MKKSLLLLSVLMGGIPMLAAFACTPTLADESVTIGGSRAVLIKPSAPRGSVILLPGGDGAIRAGDKGDIHGLLGNQLVRTRHAYAARGLAVLVADAGTDLKTAVDYMAAIRRPVTVIGTSRGTLRAAEGIARGARPDALVLTSGFLSPDSGSGSNVMSILGSPAALYLATAGVGRITLADNDTVDLTNLQRQVLHQTDSVGLPKALSQATPGIWEMSGVPSAKAPVRQCVGDLLTLAKFEHRGQNCTPKIIRDGPTATTIEYSCSGGGFGRSEVGLITPRSLRIETQGISENLPFNYVLQARRVGECGPRQSAARH